jgi:hypothetical protein
MNWKVIYGAEDDTCDSITAANSIATDRFLKIISIRIAPLYESGMKSASGPVAPYIRFGRVILVTPS